MRRRLSPLVALTAALAAGLAAPSISAAAATPFTMSLVGGSFTLAAQPTVALAGTAACQNRSDDEALPPFGTPDGLLDYPADPECASPYDTDETTAGMQAPDPVEFTGTIDGSGNFTVSSSFAPLVSTFTGSSPVPGVCDGDRLVIRATTSFSDLAPHTGNVNAGTLTLNLRLGTDLDIRCDTNLGGGTSYVAFDIDGPGGMDPWGGSTPLDCAHDVSSLNTSASGDSAPASTSKVQGNGVAGPMTGKRLKPALLFGDVFDAVPISTGDTRCPFFALYVFGTSAADNSTLQFAFVRADYQYANQPGIDVNVGDVTVYEGDGGRGALGCGGRDCRNSATVVVTLSAPAVADSTVTVIADNTTGGSATGTPAGTEALLGADYKHTSAAKPKVLSIGAGKSTAKFVIPIAPDQDDEAHETIAVDVVAVSAGLVINDGTGMVTIIDDDDAIEPDTGIAVGDAAVYESGVATACGGALKCRGTAIIPITASAPVAADLNLSFTITNGEDIVGVFDAAEAVDGRTLGDDFVPVLIPKAKLLKAGKNTSFLALSILGDATDEDGEFGAETLTVTVSGPGVIDGIGSVRILNDDT